MKGGTWPAGSPTARLIGGLPGLWSPRSADSWVKGPGGRAESSISDKRVPKKRRRGDFRVRAGKEKSQRLQPTLGAAPLEAAPAFSNSRPHADATDLIRK